MLNELLVLSTVFLVIVAFGSMILPAKKNKCVILRSIGAHSVDRAELIVMLEDAQYTFIKLFQRSSEEEWLSMQAFLKNTCRDLQDFIKWHDVSKYEASAHEWASQKAFVPENKEINAALFCILKNLQIIKLLAQHTSVEHIQQALDMRWFELINDIHRENGEIKQTLEKKEPVLTLSPDYVEPRRKLPVTGRPQGLSYMEYASMDRVVGDSEDLVSIEKESIVPRAAIPNTLTPTFSFVGYQTENDSRLERHMDPRNYGSWKPRESIVDYSDLDVIRTRMRGKADPTRTKALAHDYDFLESPEYNFQFNRSQSI